MIAPNNTSQPGNPMSRMRFAAILRCANRSREKIAMISCLIRQSEFFVRRCLATAIQVLVGPGQCGLAMVFPTTHITPSYLAPVPERARKTTTHSSSRALPR